MNKETRKFILGIILAAIGVIALAIQVTSIKEGGFGGWDYAYMAGNIYTCVFGCILIKKSIE